MHQLIQNNSLILMEAAIVERLRRSSHCELHDELLNAPLIYAQNGQKALTELYKEYVTVAIDSEHPILLFTPTWRANRSRVQEANCPESINIDASHFMQDFRDSQKQYNVNIKIGGLLACKNDCYRPEQGLSTSVAQQFHSWQINQLAQSGVDFLIAQTLPNVHEALGIARAMETSKIPYIISFVISRDGFILDGTSLTDAIEYIDSNTSYNPLGYMVNCSYPTFLCPELQPDSLFKRLIGFQANASSLDHCDLDDTMQLEADNLFEWRHLMIELNKQYGIKMLGGCCGTDSQHLEAIAPK